MGRLAEAVDYLERTPHAVPNAFLLAHPEGLRTVEVFPRSRHPICQHPEPDAEAPGKTLASMVFSRRPAPCT